MIDYTEYVRRLMEDLVSRVPSLSHVDLRRVLVFARLGRTGAHGAFAACHWLMSPDVEPAFHHFRYWTNERTGALVRRSECFVERWPEVRLGSRRISHLISIALPRFCDQTLKDMHKDRAYGHGQAWLAKLDTIVHELYHVDEREGGIRRGVTRAGRPSTLTHTPEFFQDVRRMVREYLAGGPDPAMREFLAFDFDELTRRHGGVAATTFRQFPAFPQRYRERLADQTLAPRAPQIVPVPGRSRPRLYTEADLVTRQFLRTTTRPPLQ
jgi:hypothetical protein